MSKRGAMGLGLALVLGVAGLAEAQWVFLARTALGAIKHLTSDGKETATVIIEGKAPNVYADAIAIVQRNPGLQITKRDDATRTFTFTDGQQSASIRVASLSDTLCQLIALSDAKKDGTSAASMIVQGTLRICGQLGVQCSVSQD
jgi:hypothetical protein